jgi:hypothetical protein
VGKSLEFYHHANRLYTTDEQADAYREALPRGREVAASLQGADGNSAVN